jgi:(p)ppGpp synthase/HD superfamily hydrolase
MTLTTAQCATIAKVAHKGQKYGDMRYFHGHVCEVVKELSREGYHPSEAIRQLAYLHDVAEDTNFTMSDLASLGVDRHVLECLGWLTRSISESYTDYIENIITLAPYEAALVKIADLRVNLRMSEKSVEILRGCRASSVGEKKYLKAKARVKKYSLALLAFKMIEKGPSVTTDRNNP